MLTCIYTTVWSLIQNVKVQFCDIVQNVKVSARNNNKSPKQKILYFSILLPKMLFIFWETAVLFLSDDWIGTKTVFVRPILEFCPKYLLFGINKLPRLAQFPWAMKFATQISPLLNLLAQFFKHMEKCLP